MNFEPGKTYHTRSACNHNCIFRHKIISRTAKTVTINVDGDNVKRKTIVWDGNETIYPYGKYSMCPILNASRFE